MQFNRESIHENINRVNHDYIVGDKIMFSTHAVNIYETPYKG